MPTYTAFQNTLKTKQNLSIAITIPSFYNYWPGTCSLVPLPYFIFSVSAYLPPWSPETIFGPHTFRLLVLLIALETIWALTSSIVSPLIYRLFLSYSPGIWPKFYSDHWFSIYSEPSLLLWFWFSHFLIPYCSLFPQTLLETKLFQF